MIGGLFSLGGLGDALQKPLNSVDNAVNKASDVTNNGIDKAGQFGKDGFDMFNNFLSSPMLLIGGAVALIVILNK